jgi:soluble lytic murein transglycosylase-like protein
MATFSGAWVSPQPNVLFNPIGAMQAAETTQRNRLMTEASLEDRQLRQEDRRAAVFERDRDHVARASASILALPPQERPAAYASTVRELQAAGIAPHAPAEYPGDQQLQALVSRAMPVSAQLTRQDQQAERSAVAGMFGAAPSQAAAPSAPAGNVTAPPELMPYFEEASRTYGVPVPLLVAQAKQESNFNPAARGRAGEIGVMQIMPSTAVDPGFGMSGVAPHRLDDPRTNILFGAQYLAARNRGTDWNNPQQRDAGLGRYNGGGDPNYAANVTRNLSPMQQAISAGSSPGQAALAGGGIAPNFPGSASNGGVAARTGGTDVAGPGAPTGGLALDPPGTPSWAAGTTAEDQQTLRAMSQVRGVTQEEILREAARMRQANRAYGLQQRNSDERANRRGGNEPAGPIGGNGLDSALLNILVTGDPSTPQYAAAYARLGAEEVLANGNTRRPDMSPFRAPTYRPPGVMEPGAYARPPGSPSSLPQASTETLLPAAPQLPQPPLADASPQLPQGGRSYGRAEVTQAPPSQVTTQGREAVRKAEAEVSRITGSIDRFEQLFREQGGGSLDTYLNNPRDPKAQQLLAAYEAMKATLRSESFLNTGVLQPAEAKMLDDMLLSPQSLRGAAATPEAMAARLQEFRSMVQRGLDGQRRSAGLGSSGGQDEPRQQQADPMEGKTATNRATGARMIRRNGRWEAM